MLQPMGWQIIRHDRETEQQSCENYTYDHGNPATPLFLTFCLALISHPGERMCILEIVEELKDSWSWPGNHEVSDQIVSQCATCKSR